MRTNGFGQMALVGGSVRMSACCSQARPTTPIPGKTAPTKKTKTRVRDPKMAGYHPLDVSNQDILENFSPFFPVSPGGLPRSNQTTPLFSERTETP